MGKPQKHKRNQISFCPILDPWPTLWTVASGNILQDWATFYVYADFRLFKKLTYESGWPLRLFAAVSSTGNCITILHEIASEMSVLIILHSYRVYDKSSNPSTYAVIHYMVIVLYLPISERTLDCLTGL